MSVRDSRGVNADFRRMQAILDRFFRRPTRTCKPPRAHLRYYAQALREGRKVHNLVANLEICLGDCLYDNKDPDVAELLRAALKSDGPKALAVVLPTSPTRMPPGAGRS